MLIEFTHSGLGNPLFSQYRIDHHNQPSQFHSDICQCFYYRERCHQLFYTRCLYGNLEFALKSPTIGSVLSTNLWQQSP